jgi:membrane associated rhomboid family serine protease
MDPAKFIYRPWTIITSMFTHEDLGHIFYNMLLFFMMGRIFLFVTNFRKGVNLLFLYIAGGISGSILVFLFALVIPNFIGAIGFGASAAVMAITLAAGVFSPNYPINLILIGEIKLKWLVGFIFLTSTVIDVVNNTGGKIAHLGGSIFGIIYAVQLKNGNDLSEWFLGVFKRKHKVKLKVVHNQNKRGVRDEEYNGMKRDEERVLNDLLDKINKSGYESLSKSEKETLHLLSKKK